MKNIDNQGTLTKEQIQTISTHSHPQQGTFMLIDISPSDKNQEWNKKPLARMVTMWQKYKDLYLKIFNYCSYYELCQEVSINGRVHYHSNVIIDSPYELACYLGTIKQISGDRVDYDTVQETYIEYRRQYIKKDEGIYGHRYMETGTDTQG